MKLWLLRPTIKGKELLGFDCAEGFVIRAKSSVRARQMIEDDVGGCGGEGVSFWGYPNLSSCVELKSEGKEGIVIRDYCDG